MYRYCLLFPLLSLYLDFVCKAKMKRPKIFSGSSHPSLSKKIVDRLGLPLGRSTTQKYGNGEANVEIGESVRDEDVYIIQSATDHVNEDLMELLIMIHDCKIASARRITAVLPCLPYAKQSKKKKSRGGITSKLIANMLCVAGVDHVITVDLHSSQTQGFFRVPVDNLLAEPSIAQYITTTYPDYATHGIVVAKNAGAVKRVTSLADRLKVDFALIHRTAENVLSHVLPGYHSNSKFISSTVPRTNRNNDSSCPSSPVAHRKSMGNLLNDSLPLSPAATPDNLSIRSRVITRSENSCDLGETEDDLIKSSMSKTTEKRHDVSQRHAMTHNILSPPGTPSRANSLEYYEDLVLIGDVAGKMAFVLDDMMDHCIAFITAAYYLKGRGATKVVVIGTHGVLSGDSLKQLEACVFIDEIVVTNTVPIRDGEHEKLRIIDISSTLAEAIRRTHNGESVSHLFHDVPGTGAVIM